MPLTRTDVLEIIRNGEGSGVEFKRDEVEPQEVAKAIVSFLNFQGGTVLLGVDDSGTVRGTTRANLEEWTAELCRRHVEPPVIPFLAWFPDLEPGRTVLAVHVESGPDKPYARVYNDRRTYFVRVGRSSREASREELERMFQASGRVHYGGKPVPGSGFDDLDLRRLEDYLGRILGGRIPASVVEWEQLLADLELMFQSDTGGVPCTVDGVLLFGRNPRRFLPQSGLRALAYAASGPNHTVVADEILRGPLTGLRAEAGSPVEAGLVEQTLEFLRRTTAVRDAIIDGRREEAWPYPQAVLREVVVNALVHRDYSIAGTDVTVTVYADRLEVESPGRLPNTATVERVRAGFRYARNQNLVNVMRDYRYVEARGRGIRETVIPGMRAHNGTEPELVETGHSFLVRLWRSKPAT